MNALSSRLLPLSEQLADQVLHNGRLRRRLHVVQHRLYRRAVALVLLSHQGARFNIADQGSRFRTI